MISSGLKTDQTDRKTDRQTDRKTDRKTCILFAPFVAKALIRNCGWPVPRSYRTKRTTLDCSGVWCGCQTCSFLILRLRLQAMVTLPACNGHQIPLGPNSETVSNEVAAWPQHLLLLLPVGCRKPGQRASPDRRRQRQPKLRGGRVPHGVGNHPPASGQGGGYLGAPGAICSRLLAWEPRER